jgi:hypothetical protein
MGGDSPARVQPLDQRSVAVLDSNDTPNLTSIDPTCHSLRQQRTRHQNKHRQRRYQCAIRKLSAAKRGDSIGNEARNSYENAVAALETLDRRNYKSGVQQQMKLADVNIIEACKKSQSSVDCQTKQGHYSIS